MNKLYCGDNLDILREDIKDESIDLIYLALLRFDIQEVQDEKIKQSIFNT